MKCEKMLNLIEVHKEEESVKNKIDGKQKGK